MSDPYRKYDGIAYRELRFKLLRDGLSEQEVEETLLDIKHVRAGRTIKKKQQQQLNKQWGEVIEALQHERRIVRGMMRYKTKTPAPERNEFVEQYYGALSTLYERLCKKKVLDRVLPEHSHWTDFVPDRIKDAFALAANSVPPRDKAKFKEPFQRTSPIILSDLRRGRLLRATRATLEAVIAKQDVQAENVQLERKEWLLRMAITRINALPLNAHIPNHWADMVRDRMQPDDDTETAKVKVKPSKRSLNAKLQPEQDADKPPMGMQKVDFENWRSTQKKYTEMMVKQPLSATLAKLLK